jgi:hypothetical protein
LELIHRVLVAANAFLDQGLVTGSSHHLLDFHKGTMCCTGQCSALIRIPAQLHHNGLELLNHMLTVLVDLPERCFELLVLCILDSSTDAVDPVLCDRYQMIERGRNITRGRLIHRYHSCLELSQPWMPAS